MFPFRRGLINLLSTSSGRLTYTLPTAGQQEENILPRPAIRHTMFPDPKMDERTLAHAAAIIPGDE